MTWFGTAEQGLDLYHVGLVVPDIEAAMEQYAGLLGFDWSPPGESTFDVRVDGEPQQARVLATYSRQGPPYLELVQDLTGVWSQLGMSHVGFWTPDLPGAVERVAAAGLPGRVQHVAAQGKPALFSYHEMAGGFWLELVSTQFEPRLAARLARP